MVRLEGSDDFVPTNIISFDVVSNGPVGEFGFTGTTEVTVQQGQFTEFAFENADNASDYRIDLFDEYGTWFDVGETCNGNTVIVSTIGLPVGTYTVCGRANGEFGYEGRDAYNTGVLNVTETTEPVYFGVSNLNPATLEQVLVSCRIEGAAGICLRLRGGRRSGGKRRHTGRGGTLRRAAGERHIPRERHEVGRGAGTSARVPVGVV